MHEQKKVIDAYRASDRGHVTLHFRGSGRDLLRGESEALQDKHDTKGRRCQRQMKLSGISIDV